MPLFEVKTNLSKHKFTPELLKRISQKIADLMSLAPAQIEVVVTADQIVNFNSTSEAAISASLTAVIGVGGADLNRPIIQGLSGFLEKELGVKNDRILLVINKPEGSSVGYYGQLISDILAKK